MLNLAITLAGCSVTPARIVADASAGDELNLLTRAVNADARAREALWRDAAGGGSAAPARLHRALLQSFPGHSGYDPAAAQTGLRDLLNLDLSPDQEALARFRLAQIGSEKKAAECRDDVAMLKKRLAEVVDIEKQFGNKRN